MTEKSTLETRLLRALDIAIALLALVALMPLMVLIAIFICLFDPGPVFYGHTRIGLGGREFQCLKFRSMVVNSQERLRDLLERDPLARQEWELFHKLSRDPRVTMLGRFLRKSSLDELPQLFNVLRGEMSMVGPRPITTDETWRYGRYLPSYVSVKPGLTGLWQVSGRSNTTYRRRVALDVAWSRQISTGLYLGILTRTIPAVLKAEGSA